MLKIKVSYGDYFDLLVRRVLGPSGYIYIKGLRHSSNTSL